MGPKPTVVETDALISELDALVRNLEAQASALQSSHAALVSAVNELGMRVDADLIGGVSEDLRTLQKDMNSLFEVFRGYPGLVTDIDTKFNRDMARLSTLDATIVNVDNVLDKLAEVTQHARHGDATKRH
ncbi:hypothetical protein BWQ96_07435 [Gracilariopsis chorda]|uniref:Biogenesis of lysosome-related organelles complex 1 subunit 2 n=1 Tax=Gracilariopsis chorda TaxID=448386 RepID=A0A2V3IL75_9FLOR|nr:hypothetical protein BWQ96_07435 [Gracilariopsis chorda]|eukprot:PXF42841.1 hypothetical protein BWQ96_07435 [Gracilariopsis chorda]